MILQSEHPADAARISSLGGESLTPWEERGMIVLFLKHVHLQKDGGARQKILARARGSRTEMLFHLTYKPLPMLRAKCKGQPIRSLPESSWREIIMSFVE